MAQDGQITFYTHRFSPFCQRVHIALDEANADYASFFVDVKQKPEWYSTKVNTVTGKIPALSYGGPKHPPEEPSPEVTVLVESAVILEFLAETFPSAHLLPRDALLRARARIFLSVVDGKIVDGLRSHFFKGGPASDLLAALDTLQTRLPPGDGDGAKFAVGEWSIADMAAGPFLAWIVLTLENDLVPGGKETAEALRGPRFARLMKYFEAVKARPSFRATWDEAGTLAYMKAIPAFQRN